MGLWVSVCIVSVVVGECVYVKMCSVPAASYGHTRKLARFLCPFHFH